MTACRRKDIRALRKAKTHRITGSARAAPTKLLGRNEIQRIVLGSPMRDLERPHPVTQLRAADQ